MGPVWHTHACNGHPPIARGPGLRPASKFLQSRLADAQGKEFAHHFSPFLLEPTPGHSPRVAVEALPIDPLGSARIDDVGKLRGDLNSRPG
eukprot:4334753-Pyramimonas_sp.AAC.1